MATLKIVHEPGKYNDPVAYQTVLEYCLRPDKTPGNFIGGRNIDTDYAAEEMETISQSFRKTDKTKVRHFILSFSPTENMTPAEVAEVADQAADYYSARHQIVFAVHEDTDHPHAHFVMNHVSFRDGRHYNGTKRDYYALQHHIKKVLAPYHIKLNVTD